MADAPDNTPHSNPADELADGNVDALLSEAEALARSVADELNAVPADRPAAEPANVNLADDVPVAAAIEQHLEDVEQILAQASAELGVPHPDDAIAAPHIDDPAEHPANDAPAADAAALDVTPGTRLGDSSLTAAVAQPEPVFGVPPADAPATPSPESHSDPPHAATTDSAMAPAPADARSAESVELHSAVAEPPVPDSLAAADPPAAAPTAPGAPAGETDDTHSARSGASFVLLLPLWICAYLMLALDYPFRTLNPKVKRTLGAVAIVTALMAAVAWSLPKPKLLRDTRTAAPAANHAESAEPPAAESESHESPAENAHAESADQAADEKH
ncbi:MAG: hypothetical protein U1A27_04060 [Phycisphaerae bacterium]